MQGELLMWLDAQNIDYIPVDTEVVAIPDFGKLFRADLSGVDSIFRGEGDNLTFNLMERPEVLMEEGIFHVAFPFGRNWYYYDLRETFRFNILKYIGRPKPPRHDIPFVNLGIHTPYELLNASGALEIWCRKAKWLGHTAVGIADRNTMAATLNLQKECAKAGLKHVFGYSLTMLHNEDLVDVKVYSLNNQGLHNLLRIQRAVMVDSEKHVLAYDRLLSCAAGCALVFATRSVYWITSHPGQLERIRRGFETVYYQVDGSEYKADRIDRERLSALKHYFEKCYDTATDSFIIEPILLSDCHYVDREDAASKLLLNKIAWGAAHEQSDDLYFKNVDEHYYTLRPLFSEKWDFDALFRRMCNHTVELAGQADATFETGCMFMPEYRMRPEELEQYGDRRTMFLRLLNESMKTKIPASEHGRYRERLDEEIYIIESTDNVDYFLIQWDMVREACRRGIATGIGRGSAGGSLVAYLLGITSVDPLKYDLIFSRFLVPERCGLNWKEEITVLAPDVTLQSGERYVEVMMNGMTYRLCTDSRLRVVRDGKEITIYADELIRGDEILFDRRDLLWNLKDFETHESELRTPPSL
ncbi:PHP domain-containing protein [uncultured Duncaniella sp.]|uniref:PHP domain-containing protein n=1 Tax=uncultured Duncaniella sp. TaxID=2768039 RepID=UPI0025A9B5F0|nr:PHP domain-containing protein [uncultured Duncaniella sp.]